MTMADTLTKIRFEKVTAAIGARVDGIALDQQPTPDVMETLRQGLHEHGVLFFEFGKRVETDQFKAFAQLFGEVEAVFVRPIGHDPRLALTAVLVDAAHGGRETLPAGV